MSKKIVRIDFSTSHPIIRYRYEDGDWQLSNLFEVESGLDSYTFHAEDNLGCKASKTLTEDELDFPEGDGQITINKAVTAGDAGDNAVPFKFIVEGATTYEVLASVDEPRVLKNLPLGIYTITEADPPSGYLTTETPKEVTLTLDNKEDEVTFTNTIDPDPVPTGDGQVTFKKVVTNEEPVDTSVVFKANLIGPIIKYGIEVTVDTDGVVSNLPDGDYTVEEAEVPEGYVFHVITPSAFTISADNHVATMFNTAGIDPKDATGEITIRKKIINDNNDIITHVEDNSVIDTYLSLDSSLHNTLTGVSFDLLEAGDRVNIFSYQDESWQKDAVGWDWGSIIEDHEGNLRVYYGLRHVNGITNRSAPCLSKSIDGGQTFDRVRKNLNPDIIDDSNSNIIYVESPTGYDDDEISNFSVYYDENAPISERYKAMFSFDKTVYVSSSKDGLSFKDPIKIFKPDAGDASYSAFSYDEKASKWVAIGRGRKTDVPPSSGPPKPYGTRRYVIKAESYSWDTGWTEVDKTVIDPAAEWSYGDEADYTGYWNKVSNGCGESWEPVNAGKKRPNIYRGTGKYYKGYQIGFFPVYFRDDNRVPYTRPSRTTGPIYPVLAYSRDNGNSWIFEDNDKGAVDLSLYNRIESNQCHSSSGISETGQLYSTMLFDKHNGKIFMGVSNRITTHYEDDLSDYASTDRDIDILSIREDGFGKVHGTGEWVTKNIILSELTESIILNSSGNIDIEILDSNGNPITDFTRADFTTISGDDTAHACSWTGDPSTLKGQTVKFKFYLTSAEIYSFSTVSGDVTTDDELFTGDLEGKINVEGLTISQNNPAIVKNLLLGGYRFLEDEKTGWRIKDIEPEQVTLTEDNKEEEILVTNEYNEITDPEFDDSLFYIVDDNGSGEDPRWELHKCTATLAGGITILDSVTLPYSGLWAGVFGTGNILTLGFSASLDDVFLDLFDSDLGQVGTKTVEDAGDNEAPIRCYRDYDDSIYLQYSILLISGHFTQKVIKFNSDLSEQLWSTQLGTEDRTLVAGNVTKNHVFVACAPTGDPINIYILDKKTGDEVDSSSLADGASGVDSGWVGNFPDGRFVFMYAVGSDVKWIKYDENAKELSTGTILGSANGTPTLSRRDPVITEDSKVIISSGNDALIFDDSFNFIKKIEPAVSGSQAIGKFGLTTDPNRLLMHGRNDSTSSGSIYELLIEEGTQQNLGAYDTVNIEPNANLGFGMKVENPWVQAPNPDPPTGPATLTIAKTITNGNGTTDNDIEFTVNVLGPINIYNQKVTANTDLVLEVPYGDYIIEEIDVPANFEQTSVSPSYGAVSSKGFAQLTEVNDTETVTFTNNKLSGGNELATGTLTIESLTAGSNTEVAAEGTVRFTKQPTTNGKFQVVDLENPNTGVNIFYDPDDSVTVLADRLTELLNGDDSHPDISGPLLNSPVTAVRNGDRVEITAKQTGSAGNNISFKFTFEEDFLIEGATDSVTKTLAGGQDADIDFIHVEYPYRENPTSPTPDFHMSYNPSSDTPSDVASALATAINAQSGMNITASAVSETLTIVEKRIGSQYAGNIVRFTPNWNTMSLDPANGQVTLQLP